jgi:hypothetical protein
VDTDVVVRPVADFEIQHGQVLPAVIHEGNDATGNVQKHDVPLSAEVTAVDMEPWLPPEPYPAAAGVSLLDGERQLVVPFLAEMRTLSGRHVSLACPAGGALAHRHV